MATKQTSYFYPWEEFSPEFFKRTNIKAQTSMAIARFMTNIATPPSWNGELNPTDETLSKSLNTFKKDIQSVYEKFKKGEDYSQMNIFEKWGDAVARNFFNLGAWATTATQEKLSDLQTTVLEFWDAFLSLKKMDAQDELSPVLANFETSVKSIFGFGKNQDK